MRQHRHRPSLPVNLQASASASGPGSGFASGSRPRSGHTSGVGHRSDLRDRSIELELDDNLTMWRGRLIRKDVGSWPCDHVELEVRLFLQGT